MKIFKLRRRKTYVSPIDLFQVEFDKTHPKSDAQQAEIAKYQQIYKLRSLKVEQGGREK